MKFSELLDKQLEINEELDTRGLETVDMLVRIPEPLYAILVETLRQLNECTHLEHQKTINVNRFFVQQVMIATNTAQVTETGKDGKQKKTFKQGNGLGVYVEDRYTSYHNKRKKAYKASLDAKRRASV